jgi:hypothetical protein
MEYIGPGSVAWSATTTPPYQDELRFVRAGLSYVQLLNVSQGQSFSPFGIANN